MANVRGPLGSLDARNKFGPQQVFSGWHGLKVVRSKGMLVQRPSVTQVYMRSVMTGLSQEWGGLTSGQVASWEEWAAEHEYYTSLGQRVRGTGLDAYGELNWTRAYHSYPSNVNPPTAPPGLGLQNVWFDMSQPRFNFLLRWDNIPDNEDGEWTRWDIAGPFTNPHREARANEWRIYQFRPWYSNFAAFVGLVGGAWYWLRGVWIEVDGQRVEWTVLQGVAVVE